MSSPGGREVGRVSIRVVPDTSGFRRDLKRAVDEAEAGLKVEIPVEFDVDTAGLRAKLESIQARVTIPVDFEVDLARLRAQLEALDNSRVTIPVEIGDGTEIERLQARLAALDNKDVRIGVGLAGVAAATAQLEYLISLVGLLDGRQIDIQVDIDSGGAIGQLVALNAAMAGTSANAAVMGATSRNAFQGMASSALSIARTLLQVGAYSLGIAVAGAAITAAWGAASTAIMAIPSAILLLAAPIAAVATGMDGIKAAAKTIKPEFDKMQKAVSATFEKHMIPVFKTLTKLFPNLTEGLQGSARAVSFLGQSMANMLTSAPGLALIDKTFANINFALVSMHPGIESVVQGFLLLGSQSAIFDTLVQAVNTFGEEFRTSVIDMITDGTLDSAMAGLGDSLASLTRGFFDLVQNGLKVFAAAAPGVNQFLDSLTSFFNRFDWNRLGTSVGNVFSGLAETLDGVDTGTIRDIEDAFGRLGDLFKDKDFQADLQGVIDGLPGVIDQMRSFAKDFAAVADDISTAVDEFNTVDQKFRDFSEGFVQSAEDLGKDLGISGEGGAFDWLRKLEDDIEGFFANPPDSEQWGKDVREGFERGLEGIDPQFQQGSVGDGGSLLDWLGFDSDDLDFDLDIPDDLLKPIEDAFDDVDLAEDIGTAIGDAAQRVRDDVSKVLAPAFQESLAGLAPTITAGLQAGFLQPLTGGLALLNQLFTFNLDLLKTNLTNTFLQWAQIATLGMEQFTLAITNGFTLATLAVTTGMQQITTAITNGFAVAVPAVTVGMQQITTAIQTGFTLIVAAVQQGMTQATASLQTNWATAVSVTAGSMAAMTAAVQSGMDQIRAAVQAGMQQSAAAVQQGVQQMVSALQSGMSQAVSVVRNGVSQMVSILNSARSQFFSAGANMGQALADGLNSKVGAVQAAAARLAAAAAAATRAAAAIRSPSRVFIALGEYMGEGLAIGMNRSETEVERAARNLTSTVIDSVSSVQDALAGDAWAADFNARVNSELAQYDSTPTRPAGDKQVVIQTTINNPLPETGSDSIAKTNRRQAAMGLWS